MLPIDETTMLRVLVWASDHPEAFVSEDATDDESALAIVHRACFLKVMHPDYHL